MKLSVTYQDGEATRIVRPPSLTQNTVAFHMEGSTAVWLGNGDRDLPEVVEAVESLPFVQAVEVD